MRTVITTLIFFLLISGFIFAQNNVSRTNMIDTWTPVHHQSDGTTSIFLDDMNGDNTVTGIQARGWYFDDVDGVGSSTTFQGNTTVFSAYEGPADGYLGENYQGAFGGGLLIDQWLISPEVTVSAGDTLKFWQRSPDGSTFPDPLQVWVSSTAGTTHTAFDLQLGSFTGSTTGWQQYVYTFPNSGTVRFAVRYYSTNGGPGGSETDYIGLDYFEVVEAGASVMTIAQAIEDLDMDFVPDRLGQTVTVEGVVFGPNYQTTNNSFYIHDGTAGTDIFMYSPPLYTWAYGDKLQITGEVSQYYGMTEIIPADSTGWVFQSSGNPATNYTVLTLGEYLANAEMYEGSLVGFVSLNKVSGTWPGSGTSANLSLSDGIDTVVFRIDSDTDIDGQPEPSWPADVIGIGSQYDNAAPYNSGYQVFPRYYATDFLPPGTIPVELTSFTATANENNVTLNWSTATEKNNSGFEIQKIAGNNEFVTIGFVQGHGTTTQPQSYNFVDGNLNSGSYTYRLKQFDYNGTFSYSNEVNVDVTGPVQFELAQNYPNPFNPSTTIKFSIPQSSVVTLKIYNALGQEVRTLVNGFTESGLHTVNFDASNLNSGVYFYKLDSGQFSEVKKMTLIK